MVSDRIARGPRANCGRGQVSRLFIRFGPQVVGGTYSYLTATQERRRQRNPECRRERLSLPPFSRGSLLFPSRSFFLPLFPFLFSFLSLARLFLSPFPFSPSLSHCSAISRPEPAKIVSAVLDSACGSFQRCDAHQHRRPPLVLLPSRSKFRPGCSSVQVQAAGDQWEIGEQRMEKIRGRNLATGASGNDYN